MGATFGTWGLRGLARDFTPRVVAAYTEAFLDTTCSGAARDKLIIGSDLRQFSLPIAALAADAARACGWTPINAGIVPAPAVVTFAIDRGHPAIMITGGHIQHEHNSLKFYTPNGELLKTHEEPILRRADALLAQRNDTVGCNQDLPPVAHEVADFYRWRYLGSFAPDLLKGLRVGVFMHSAVGSAMLCEVLETLGATIEPFGQTEAFAAVDTEALDQGQLDLMVEMARNHALDAVVSTNGDGDRPLVFDENGRQINGDVLGGLAAKALSANCLITELTSTSALEQSHWFETVRRTRVGLPFIVTAMAEAEANGVERVVGFGADGGFLTQSEIELPAGMLPALPSRDAITPILAVLGEAQRQRVPLSQLAAQLPHRIMRSDRLGDIAPPSGLAFITAMAEDIVVRAGFDATLAFPTAIDTTDGTRLMFVDDVVVHFQQSSEAPELHCYVETDSELATETLLKTMMGRLQLHFECSSPTASPQKHE